MDCLTFPLFASIRVYLRPNPVCLLRVIAGILMGRHHERTPPRQPAAV